MQCDENFLEMIYFIQVVLKSVVVPAGKPPSREAALEWFRTQELARGAGFSGDEPPEWFHGKGTD